METFFLFSALVGGTLLVCQFTMTLLGLGDDIDHSDLDFADGDVASGDSATSDHHHSSWLFGVISFRTLVAASTFFGLAGKLMASAGADVRDQLLVAVASGLAALFGVHWLMQSFHRLNQSGTLRPENAVGQVGTVNVSIPASLSGAGKVQLQIQGRLEELAAVTSQARSLVTGAKVQVTGLLHGNVLEVKDFTQS